MKTMATITVLWLLQIVLAVLVHAEVQTDSCQTPEKPLVCAVQPVNNQDYALLQQLKKSLVSATSNLTVYSRQTAAVFRFEVDRSIPPMDFSPVA